jgi:hypothetical protein
MLVVLKSRHAGGAAGRTGQVISVSAISIQTKGPFRIITGH